jgi:DNA-binding MarR family transcriptional regulator
MHITSGTLASVLDTLEGSGYVRRHADPTDRRRVLVDLTPTAQAVLDRLLPEDNRPSPPSWAPWTTRPSTPRWTT